MIPKGSKRDRKWSQNGPKNHQKSMPKSRSEKSSKNNKKYAPPDLFPGTHFRPKTVQNGIRKIMKKSRPKKFPKIMQKGRKGMQNAPKMAPEILENPYKNQCRKGIEKTLKKR